MLQAPDSSFPAIGYREWRLKNAADEAANSGKQTHHQLFDSSSLQKLKTAALCALCVRMNWRPPPSRAREKSSIVRLPFAHANSALRSADNAYV